MIEFLCFLPIAILLASKCKVGARNGGDLMEKFLKDLQDVK